MIKKSAKKKAAKKVLDYDPLAWLEEGEDETQSEGSVSQSEIKEKFSAKKASTKKQVASPDKQTASNNEAVAEEDNKVDQDEAAGFGFFDDDPVEEVEQAASDEEGLAYGFFDDVPASLQTQSARIDTDSHAVNLGAELTIMSVSDCKALIDQLLHQGEEIKLQVNELQKIDSAGLQMLYSLKKTLDKSGQKIHWMSSGAVVNEVACLLGLPELSDASADDTEQQQENSAFGFF